MIVKMYGWMRRHGMYPRKTSVNYANRIRISHSVVPEGDYDYNEIANNLYEQIRSR